MKTKTGNGRTGTPYYGFLCLAAACLLISPLLTAEYSDQPVRTELSTYATESYHCDFRNHSSTPAPENYTTEVHTPYQNYSMAFNANSLDIKSSFTNRTVTCTRYNHASKTQPRPARGIEVFRIPYTPVDFDPTVDIQPSPSVTPNENPSFSPPAFWPSSTPAPPPAASRPDQTELFSDAISLITEKMFNSYRFLLRGELLTGLPDLFMPAFSTSTQSQPLPKPEVAGHYLIVMHSLKKPGRLSFWDQPPSSEGEAHVQNINNDILESPDLEQQVLSAISPLVSSGTVLPAQETTQIEEEEYFDEMVLTQATSDLLLILQNRVDVLFADNIAKQPPEIVDRNLRLIRENRHMLQEVERAEQEYAKHLFYSNRNLPASETIPIPTNAPDTLPWLPALATVTAHLTETEQPVDMETAPSDSSNKRGSHSSPSKSSGTSGETLKSKKEESEGSEDEEEDDGEDEKDPPVKPKPDTAAPLPLTNPRQHSITYHLSTILSELNPASPEFESFRRRLRQMSINGTLTEAMDACYHSLIASYQNLSEPIPAETGMNLSTLSSVYKTLGRSVSDDPEVLWTFQHAVLTFVFQEFRQNHFAWMLAQHLNARELSQIISSTLQRPSPGPAVVTSPHRSFNIRSFSSGSRERPILPPRPSEPPPMPGTVSLAHAAAVSVTAPLGEENVPVLFSLRQNQQLMAGQPITGASSAEVQSRTRQAGEHIRSSTAVRLLGNPGEYLPTSQIAPESVPAAIQRQIVSDLFRANFALTIMDNTARFRVFDSQRMAHFIRRAAIRVQEQQAQPRRSVSRRSRTTNPARSNELDGLVRFRFNQAFRDAVVIMYSDHPTAHLIMAYSATQSLGNDIAQITFDDNQSTVPRVTPLLIPSSGNTNNILYVTRQLNDLHPQLQIYYGFNSLMHFRGLGQNGPELNRWRVPATGGLWVIAAISQSLSGQIYASQIQWLFDVEQTEPIQGMEDIDSAQLAQPQETPPMNSLQTMFWSRSRA